MTASKLEESIEILSAYMASGGSPDEHLGARAALRAFAEAVREKMPVEECRKTHKWEWMCRECGVRKPPCDHNGKHLGQHCPELKLSTCKGQSAQVYCNDPDCGNRDRQGLHRATEPKESRGCAEFCDCKSPAALPDEVKECLHQGFNIVDGVVRLCSLCHKYLGLMYPPKGGAGK